VRWLLAIAADLAQFVQKYLIVTGGREDQMVAGMGHKENREDVVCVDSWQSTKQTTTTAPEQNLLIFFFCGDLFDDRDFIYHPIRWQAMSPNDSNLGCSRNLYVPKKVTNIVNYSKCGMETCIECKSVLHRLNEGFRDNLVPH
jgi:hypothetical protein